MQDGSVGFLRLIAVYQSLGHLPTLKVSWLQSAGRI